MKLLQAPWRWSFITGLSDKKVDCIFCSAQKKDDSEALICYRGKNYFVILNKYPYSTGHLMIVPYKHTTNPAVIKPEDTVEMWELMNHSLDLLKEYFNPNGFNIGMNLEEAAGAGVKDHFHLHIVPRWNGDSNFMAVIGKTKVMSYDLKEVYKKISEGFTQ
jgi:ATP adenylyltransferase